MPTVFNLHRFGLDELAVGHLINGDLPDDDEERWNILSAPRYRIRKLLDEHLDAQAALRDCRDSGTPFVLYLRSFSIDQRSDREGQFVGSQLTAYAYEFLGRIARQLAADGIPLVRLHGGSDSFFPHPEGGARVLSTTAENWEAVATELIAAASAIVLLVGELSPGVTRELELIRGQGRTGQCLVTIGDPAEAPGGGAIDVDELRSTLADFRPLEPETLATLLRGAETTAPLEHTLNAEFSYLEPDFVESDDYANTEQHIWTRLLELRVLFADTYWAALKRHGVSFDGFTFPQAWTAAHQVYGLAVATADFRAIAEALAYLHILYVFRGVDFALVVQPLASDLAELGAQLYPGGVPDTEARFSTYVDPLTLPATLGVARGIAEQAARDQDDATALSLYQAATVCALRTDEDEPDHTELVVHLVCDWAQLQSRTGDVKWALVNYELALALARNLAATDSARYIPEVTFCLNNIGAMLHGSGDMRGAEARFEESLALRRAHPSETKLEDLYLSLVNLGMVRVALEEYESARALYAEGLSVCARRSDPDALAGLIRVEALMSLCLVHIPGSEAEAREFAARAAGRLTQVDLETAAALRPLVEAAVS